MVIIVRDNECFEPRVKTYENYFKNNDIPYLVLGWNRSGEAEDDDHHIFFQKRAEYGKKVLNIPNKFLWMRFVFRLLKDFRKECDLVHACDIDAAIPCRIFSVRHHKRMVFDVFDWISTETDKNIFFWLIEKIENRIYRRTDYVILCEEERKQQARAENENIYILPNIPANTYDEDLNVKRIIYEEKKNFGLTLGYVGVFDYSRGLEELLESLKYLPNVSLQIAGFGGLEKEVRSYAEKLPNVHYWGSVSYDKGQTILSCVDIMVAFYYLSNPVHRYAAPNKYYEALRLEKPLMTTKGTLVGEKVEKYGTGIAIFEGTDALVETLSQYKSDRDMCLFAQKAKAIWETKYKNYVINFMNEIYLGKILSQEKNE